MGVRKSGRDGKGKPTLSVKHVQCEREGLFFTSVQEGVHAYIQNINKIVLKMLRFAGGRKLACSARPHSNGSDWQSISVGDRA